MKVAPKIFVINLWLNSSHFKTHTGENFHYCFSVVVCLQRLFTQLDLRISSGLLILRILTYCRWDFQQVTGWLQRYCHFSSNFSFDCFELNFQLFSKRGSRRGLLFYYIWMIRSASYLHKTFYDSNVFRILFTQSTLFWGRQSIEKTYLFNNFPGNFKDFISSH